ncbi:MAG TPA: histone deacetylase, partial [Amaricoccus sp.]|nr:histone deacetylase [Amaricoccus sp.]
AALIARRLLPPSGGYAAPAAVSVDRAAAVHALAYVERVANQQLTPAESRAIGLPDTPAVARRAFLAAAGTLLAARLALEHGVAANMAGGSHHAGPEGGAGYCVFNDVAIAARLALEHGLACNMAGGAHHAGPDGGAGYCVFNDVAVAAQALIDEGAAARVLVVDCDVHQGDGTARIFAGRPDVLTLSLHAERNYPARKAASHLDYPLPDRLGDRPYLEVLAHALAAVAPFRPDIVFYNAGVDPHAADRLGRLALSDAGLRARDALVTGWARRLRLPLACVLGGGYDSDPGRLAARHAILFEEAAGAE